MSAAYPSIAGRTVMVTGGSRGLGREMVLALAGVGAAVAVVGSRPGGALDDTVAEANRLGAGRAVAIAADVADYAQCEAAATAALDAIGPIDVLINNAGLGMRRVSETFNTKPTRFWETEPEAWKEIIDTNVNGVFNMARVLVPGPRGGGLRPGDQHPRQVALPAPGVVQLAGLPDAHDGGAALGTAHYGHQVREALRRSGPQVRDPPRRSAPTSTAARPAARAAQSCGWWTTSPTA